ncbi:MAG: dihydrodipicolinate reductase C-terminal domain-containing protein [Cloacibacillus sp.]
MKKVFLSGASGSVGKTIVRAIGEKNDLELVGGWCLEDGADLGTLAGTAPIGIAASSDLDGALIAAAPDIVIDFSSAPVMKGNLQCYLRHGLDAVVGTTGLTDAELAPFKESVAQKELRWAVIPNYGLGINLAADFIRRARAHYPFVTITEQHTNQMANAPSGTAEMLAAAAGGSSPDVKSRESFPGALGAKINGVPVFSERIPLPAPYSSHTITLARADEVVTITVADHTSDIYLDGIFLTVEKLPSLPAGSFIRSLSEITG